VAAVAQTLHYPDGLLDPKTPIADVVEYLGIRRNRPLVVSYGRFRARHST
jgi:hypothetical protein